MFEKLNNCRILSKEKKSSLFLVSPNHENNKIQKKWKLRKRLRMREVEPKSN
jgi:hypothetical protein